MAEKKDGGMSTEVRGRNGTYSENLISDMGYKPASEIKASATQCSAGALVGMLGKADCSRALRKALRTMRGAARTPRRS